ncbi:MAG: cytochrome c [Thermoanaerobaculia bacterium]
MRKNRTGWALAALAAAAVAAVLFSGCSVRRSEPVVGPIPLNTLQLQRGEVLYMRHCNQCHTGGEFGFSPALSNKPAPKFLMRTQVRAGLGAMPRFSREEISPEELDDILEYVVAVRKHGR